MRVLIEYKGKRVDIKTPISARVKVEETAEGLAQIIGEAISVVCDSGEVGESSMNFDKLANRVAEKL